MCAMSLALSVGACAHVQPKAWAERPLGIYPLSAASLNGQPVYLFGVKVKF